MTCFFGTEAMYYAVNIYIRRWYLFLSLLFSNVKSLSKDQCQLLFVESQSAAECHLSASHIRVYCRAPVYYSSASTVSRSTMTEQVPKLSHCGWWQAQAFSWHNSSPPRVSLLKKAPTKRCAAHTSVFTSTKYLDRQAGKVP